MPEEEDQYTPEINENEETSKAQEALHRAEATADFEKRKLAKLLEYVHENLEKDFNEEELKEANPLASDEIREKLTVALEEKSYDDQILVGVVEAHREAKFAYRHIRADTQHVSEENREEYDELDDVMAYSKRYIENFFIHAGHESADRIASQYLEFGGELLEDEELIEQIANAEGVKVESSVKSFDYKTVQYSDLLSGINQNIALDGVKKIKSDKLIDVEDNMSPMKPFADAVDNGVRSVFEEMYGEDVGFNAPKKFDEHLTEKWTLLRNLPRMKKVFGSENIASYEEYIEDTIFRKIITHKESSTSVMALEPLRSEKALEIVLIEASNFYSNNQANRLLEEWSRQEGWVEFLDTFKNNRGIDANIEHLIDQSIKNKEGNLNLREVAMDVAKSIAYQKDAPKYKKEYALQIMRTGDVFSWGHDMGLVDKVDFEEGKVATRTIHGMLRDLVQEKFIRKKESPDDRYDRKVIEIDTKMDQLIKYKALILESDLQDSGLDFLNTPKMVKKIILDSENFTKNSENLIRLVRGEGEFLREHSYSLIELFSSRDEPISLSELRLLKKLKSKQSSSLLNKTLAVLNKADFKSISDLITDDGELTPQLFDAIGVDNVDLFADYYDKNKSEGDTISQEMWEAALHARAFGAIDAFDDYLETRPDIKDLYEKLRKESSSEEYSEIMTHFDHYWNNNKRTVAYLHEAGIADFSFEEFRHIPSNREVLSFVNGEWSHSLKNTNLNEFVDLKEKLGININNVTVFNRDLAKILKTEIEDPKKANFYRRMLAEGKGTFRNLVTSIEKNGYDVSNKRLRRDIETAVRELGNISPILLDKYIHADNLGRVELRVKIKNLSETIRKNEPLLAGNESKEDMDLLAEQISIVFPGNSYESIRQFLTNGELRDKVEDLDEYEIREDGYTAVVTEKQKIAVLPEGKEISKDVINEISSLFLEEEEDDEEVGQDLGKALKYILNRGNDISYKVTKELLPVILSTLPDNQVLEEIRTGHYNLEDASDIDKLLGKIEEATGIFFDDNIRQGMSNELMADPVVAVALRETIRKGFKSLELVARGIEDPADQLDYLTSIGELASDVELPDLARAVRIAEIIAMQIKLKVFDGKNGLHNVIQTERDKLEYIETEQDVSASMNMKGYISKNAASFFAKGTAGICTSGDVELYMRDDHFHINLFDGDTAIGNIQVYKIEHEGKQALLFRGFNPSTKYVNKENASRITEGMVSIVTQFAKENEIEDVFVSEQLGGWHALTNRSSEGVYDYFKERYLNPEYPGYEEVEKEVSITSTQSIKQMYRIPMAKEKN